MNLKTLYSSYHHAVNHGGYPEELIRLRKMVQDILDIPYKMPDKTLLDVFRRKLFSDEIEVPPDKLEKLTFYDKSFEKMFEDMEDLFKI